MTYGMTENVSFTPENSKKGVPKAKEKAQGRGGGKDDIVMVGSEMDGDLPPALVKRRSSTKRQQQMGGGSSSSSAAAAAAIAFNDGEGDASVVGRWDKEKVRGRRPKPGLCEVEKEAGKGGGDCGAAGDDGEPAQSPLETATTTTPIPTCRKRARLNGKKPTQICNAVDPASVPRKSRSATKKRSHQSASPLLPNLKVRKKHCYIPNGTDSSCLKGGARVDHNLLFDSLTEDEKEVIEALFVLSGAVPMSLGAEEKEGTKVLQDISSGNALSPTATKEKKVEPTVFRKIATDSGCQSSKPDLNEELESCKATPLGNSVQPNGIVSNNAVMVLASSEVSHHYSENGELQPAEYDRPATLHAHKPDNNILPIGSCEPSNMLQHEVQLLEQNSTGNTGEYAAVLQGGLSSAAYEQLTRSSSSRSSICPGFAASSLNPSSNCITPGTNKLALSPPNATSSRKNCAIHICISHLIRDHQEKESQKEHILLSPTDALKSEEKFKLGTVAASDTPKIRNDAGSLVSTAPSSSLVERNFLEVRNEALRNGIYLHGQQSSILPETYAQQKQHPFFLHPQVQQRATSPFHFTQISHTSQYSEKLSAVAKPQVNLQVLPYFGNQFYVQPGSASNTKLQQQYQMWQAQVARCGSSMGVGALQNGHLHDPTSFFRMSAQSSPSIFVGVQGVSYRPPNAQEQLQLLSTPTLTSSMGRYHQEHHHQSGGRHNGSALLQEGGAPQVQQLLCNVQRS